MTETEMQTEQTKTNILCRLYLNSRNPHRSAWFWNMVAAMTSSFQSMLFMLVLTRFGEVEAASYIAIGFAAANLAMTVGKFGVRNFQVTDVAEKYRFRDYRNMRVLTIAAMAVFTLIYCGFNVIYRQYVPVKTATVALLCIYKMIESTEDVWHGRLQQIGRLDISAKIWATRNILFIAEFIICYFYLRDLIGSLIISIVTTLVLSLLLNRIPRREYRLSTASENSGKMKPLLIECIPVAFATFLLMYISNAPKYIIDSVVSDREQTYFNILFMVIYIVTLLSNFMFNPVLNRMAIWREQGEHDRLLKRIIRLIAAVAGIVAVGVLFAEVIGTRMLGWIYGVSLDDYHVEVDLMLIAGGLIAILNLLYLIIILLRKQAIFYIIFTAVSLLLVITGKSVLRSYELRGLCCYYIGILLAADIIMFLCVFCLIRKEIRNHTVSEQTAGDEVTSKRKSMTELAAGKRVLFLSTKNRDYIRNLQEIRILRENAAEFEEIVFSDSSYPKRILKVWRVCLGGAWKRADVIFVGFSPQLVFPFLRKWDRRKTVIIDFFISMYDTCVNDRSYFGKKSLPARILHRIDKKVLKNCHHVIVDTAADGRYFSKEFQTPFEKMEVLYLEADTDIYDKERYKPAGDPDGGFVVLYFGSILPLQGVGVILEAQRILSDRSDIRFVMIGPVDGQKVKKEDFPYTTFYEWLSQPELAAQIATADLCLAGHFHPTIDKASRTIPGKAYIYEAMEKKMILGDNPANRELFAEDERHLFAEMGNARALADMIAAAADKR